MKKLITIDDELLAEATSSTGIQNVTAFIHEGLQALIQRHAARQVIELGGSEPGMKPIPRRRPAA